VLSLSTHRAFELVVGLILLAVPLALGVGNVVTADASGVVVCIVLGALIVTLALSADHEGRSLAGSPHAAADRALAAALAVAAVVLALLGQGLPAGLCAGAAILEGGLTLFTRYVVRPGRDDETRATTLTAG
jgi:hypothetical protein